MTEWIVYENGQKRLSENYDYCEKCQELFYGPKCSICGTLNTRTCKVEEVTDGEKEESDEETETP